MNRPFSKFEAEPRVDQTPPVTEGRSTRRGQRIRTVASRAMDILGKFKLLESAGFLPPYKD